MSVSTACHWCCVVLCVCVIEMCLQFILSDKPIAIRIKMADAMHRCVLFGLENFMLTDNETKFLVYL